MFNFLPCFVVLSRFVGIDILIPLLLIWRTVNAVTLHVSKSRTNIGFFCRHFLAWLACISSGRCTEIPFLVSIRIPRCRLQRRNGGWHNIGQRINRFSPAFRTFIESSTFIGGSKSKQLLELFALQGGLNLIVYRLTIWRSHVLRNRRVYILGRLVVICLTVRLLIGIVGGFVRSSCHVLLQLLIHLLLALIGFGSLIDSGLFRLFCLYSGLSKFAYLGCQIGNHLALLLIALSSFTSRFLAGITKGGNDFTQFSKK